MKNRLPRFALLALAGAALSACGGDDKGPIAPQPTATPTPTPSGAVTVFDFDFAIDSGGWQTGFADYSPGMEVAIGFESGLRNVPPDLVGQSGLLLGGSNASDDLALFAWRKVINLQPSTPYRIDVALDLASNAPEGCVGIGGAPGESVPIKAGASDVEPDTLLMDGLIVLNVDKGQQFEEGEDTVILGDLAIAGAGDCSAPVYALKSFDNAGAGAVVRSNAAGELWLIVTSDSGYEGRSEFYLLQATFTLTPA